MIVFEGNLNLLVAAPMLQDALVDKDGTAMSGGTITCYHDNSRTTLKNWYYQTGSGGNYIYIALPNPLTLSAAGTICDINGVDTIPFFYPYDEADTNTVPARDPYYITIVNHDRTNQITRENFPFLPPEGAVSAAVNTFNNLIINSGFWRNMAPNMTNITPYKTITYDTSVLALTPASPNYSAIIAPSQHDGFSMPDIQYQQAILTGTNTVTFTPFPLGNSQPVQNTNTISPEYYINHVCSVAGTGQTQKCYQFPISLHLNTIANQPFTFSIQAQNVGGTSVGANVITIYLLQFTGTGGTPVAPIEITQFALNTSWDQYSFSDFFPATSGLNLGLGGDDAWYLQVQMPLSTTCAINFTKPSIYLTENVLPTNDFQTYDQIDAVINSPRTGDVRISMNSFYNFSSQWLYGWVVLDDHTIGNSSSNATGRANADTWPLFNLLWQAAKPYDTGSTFNEICQMLNSAFTPINYGSSAISDFNANNQIVLTKTLGRVLMGSAPIGIGQLIVSVSNPSGSILQFAVGGTHILFQGSPVAFFERGGTLPTGVVANAIYYMTAVNNIAGTYQIATTYANALNNIAISYIDSGSGIIFMLQGPNGSTTGEYAHSQTESEMAIHNHPGSNDRWTSLLGSYAAGGTPHFYAVAPGNTAINITNDGAGLPANIVQPAAFYNMYMKL